MNVAALALRRQPARASGRRRSGSAWHAAAGLVVASAAAAGWFDGTAVLRLAVLLAVAPLAEETLLRAGLHEALLRRAVAPAAANLACALLFGLAHAVLQASPAALAVALPALLVGALYRRTRRLRDAVALHAFFNALWLAAALAGLLPRFLR